ncbi:T9SS type A sorting domain-containing protein [Flavobacterium sp. NST-5]|uniref:Aminopeptidase N n=1 Tax=Flavobacterium ichthyis TaxID=2698827 RepID=A0ABW9Z7Z6_9FLAO|nr:M1 family aminopeptidase [Flavobacterium ichthyis]NBL64983.1 T9SS type A sorting domain-containing protein [Flavobacterium ichthyis]
MKKIIFLTALIQSFFSLAQNVPGQTQHIAESERKSAAKRLAFRENLNTANYDVKYHRLALNINPEEFYISGMVTTHFVAKQNLNSVTFDLNNQLTVTQVLQRGNSLTFSQNTNNELVINLQNTQNTNVLDSLSIIYEGIPSTDENAFTTYTHAGVAGLYTLSEPFGAKDWWPCKQSLDDKVDRVDFLLTTPTQYVAVANGLQTSVVTNGNGTKTTRFTHNYLIPAYLVAIAATNYTIFTQTAGTAPNQFPIVNYLYPETQTSVQNNLAVTPPIMDLFEDLFEKYPFSNEKYGHAQCALGGGMEHTTVSFMGSFGRELIAHELAHQWFGDKITCGTWKDIWLNEGFATYLSGLVVENFDGQTNFNSWKQSVINNITSQNGGAVYLTDAEAQNVSRIFNHRLSYNKAAMVLHMLRFKLGDAVFFQAIKNYLADPNLAYGYAVTEDFKTHLETASGTSLTEFFNDWVYGQGYPSYNIVVQNWTGGQARFTINQTQSHNSVSFFEMPVPVRVTGNSGQILDLILQNTTNDQVIFANVPFTVTGISVNPNFDIISRNNTATLSTENFGLATHLKLYPNPASNEIFSEGLENISLEKTMILNTLGQVVLQSKNEKKWDVSALPSGTYFLKIFTSEGVFQHKFLKK